jgi:hypothetical protein
MKRLSSHFSSSQATQPLKDQPQIKLAGIAPRRHGFFIISAAQWQPPSSGSQAVSMGDDDEG